MYVSSWIFYGSANMLLKICWHVGWVIKQDVQIVKTDGRELLSIAESIIVFSFLRPSHGRSHGVTDMMN